MVPTRAPATKPFTMKVSINSLQEANGRLRPALLQHARLRPAKSIAGKAIVCEMNNGESQTHFTSAAPGLKVPGVLGPGCRAVFEGCQAVTTELPREAYLIQTRYVRLYSSSAARPD